MLDLMEWSGEQSDYQMTSLYATLSALVNPASIVYTEYADIKRTVKREKTKDGYKTEEITDDILSGFKDTVVSTDELFIENFFEPDIQKQGWLVWRRVISYSMAEERFKGKKNFEHVQPGIQTLFNDANQTFYWVYDPNMRQMMVEWVQYYNRSLDLKLDVLNGVLVGDYDACNPRNDKLYPFVKFGYEIINNRCFYYKSLAFKLMHDANIINTLYPMIIDGTYLNLFPPMVLAGEENVSSNIIVPGRATALTNPASTLMPIQLGTNLKAGFDSLNTVEESLNQSSEVPVNNQNQKGETAYEISVRENERNTILGLFIQMIGSFVKQYGRLRLGDIVQYLTIGEVQKIEGDMADPATEQALENAPLVYRTFLRHGKESAGKLKTRKISFDSSLPNELPIEGYDKQVEKMSYETMDKQGGFESDTELFRVNPELFRDLTYMLVVSPDVMNPLSESVERAYNLEVYDRGIANPIADQEAIFELLLESTPTTKKDPSKFIMKQNPLQNPAMQAMGGMNPPQPTGLPKAPQPAMAGQ
jgi:hypothetical protein